MSFRSLLVLPLLSMVLAGCSSASYTQPSPSATAASLPTTSGSPTPEPAIVVSSPRPGDQVSSPVRIQGTADVFEATVSISILDATGNSLVETFTTATCGSGCRGTFSKAFRFTIGATQTGTVRVYEVSAEDGAPINVVDIPVTLVAYATR